MAIAETPHCFDRFIHVKCQFREKNPLLPIEKFRSHVIPSNAIMLQHLLIQLTLYSLSSGPLQEVKNKREFQTFSSESGRGRI